MDLIVYDGKEKTDLICNTGAPHRTCLVTGRAFSVDVLASQPPAIGYTAYKVVLQYSSNIKLQPQPGLTENRAPNCLLGSEIDVAPTRTQDGLYSINCKQGPKTTYSGPLANINFECPKDGSKGQVDLIGGAGANVSVYINPAITGSFYFLKSSPKDGKNVADSVSIVCPALPPDDDTDGDGCTNGQELGTNPALGGLRNPKYFWDFFDVWSHPAGDPLAWERNRQIGLFGDIFGVAARFGAVRGSPPTKGEALAEALAPPTNETGYHAAFDRSPPPNGVDPWALGPPDGTIDLFVDILGVAAQFGHSCA
jgi:hypothetical protein